MKHSYEYYRRNKLVRTEDDILNLIKRFPGISFTEIYKTTRYNSGRVSVLLRKIGNDLIIVHDETCGRNKANSNKSTRSLYFHKDMWERIESLTK